MNESSVEVQMVYQKSKSKYHEFVGRQTGVRFVQNQCRFAAKLWSKFNNFKFEDSL